MRRLICIVLALCLPLCALAEGVTLRTASTFAGADTAAEVYVELLKAFEEETGCIIIDDSATSDESWKTGILYDFAAGNEPDVLFFFAANADSTPILSRVVPIDEINTAYPELNLTVNPALAEADGRVYAIPVRPYWEGLFVNTDLFAQYGLALPDTWEKLEQAIVAFREAGIVPIAVSFSDVPHYLAEIAILVSGSVADHEARPRTIDEVPASWLRGTELIRRLREMGAFADNAFATTETMSSQLFREKKAAMQIDGSWFANSIPQSSMDTTIVMPMPAWDASADPRAFIGGTSMGFYLTRKAWEDPAKRDAAVQLLAWLTSKENARALGGTALSGALQESVYALLETGGVMLRPFQDDMSQEAREFWLLDGVAAVSEGTMTAEECWRQVMQLHPFD